MTKPKPRSTDTLSPADVAARWGVSSETVRSLLKSGELCGFRLGPRLMRISTEALHDYEQRKTIMPERDNSPAKTDEEIKSAAVRIVRRRKPIRSTLMGK